jgi:hypothetical protein
MIVLCEMVVGVHKDLLFGSDIHLKVNQISKLMD